MKKDPEGEKLMDGQLMDVQGGAGSTPTAFITCLQCGKQISGPEHEADQAQQEHTNATGHTRFSKTVIY